MPLLDIEDLHVQVEDQVILGGVDLTVTPGEVHAVMGPNGSGKSTLANVVAGRPGYEVLRGSVRLGGEDITHASAEERALRGLFLAFQYPIEIPGVSNMEFLKAATDSHALARGEGAPSAAAFIRRVRATADRLGLDAGFLKRGVNEGFSGGEKKRNEILQMLLLEPRVAILDETDSGLDVDAMQVVAAGVNDFRDTGNAVILVTHYQRLLDHIVPDHVHVLAGGTIVRSGDRSLAQALDRDGYGWIEDAC